MLFTIALSSQAHSIPSGLEIPEDKVWYTDGGIGYIISDEDLKEVYVYDFTNNIFGCPMSDPNRTDIPAFVSHDGVEYTVVGIDSNSFNSAAIVSLPKTITTIENRCFNSYGDFSTPEQLISFTLPSELQSIGDNSFNTIHLQNIKFNDKLKKIGNSCFNYSQYLTSIEFNKNLREIGNDCFKENSLIKEVYLPNSLYYIGENFFSDCEAIEKVRLPRWLPFGTYHYAVSPLSIFNNCPNIRVIEWDCMVPPEMPKSFNAVDKSKCTVIVPDGCKSVYEENNYWKDFIIVEKSQYQASVAELPVDENCEDSYYTLNGFRIHSPENLEKGEIYLKVTDKGTSKFIHR